jgi:hypothetical protein
MTSQAQPAFRLEPHERDDEGNTMLDAWENLTRQVLGYGHEQQLKARLARLLSKVSPAPAEPEPECQGGVLVRPADPAQVLPSTSNDDGALSPAYVALKLPSVLKALRVERGSAAVAARNTVREMFEEAARLTKAEKKDLTP